MVVNKYLGHKDEFDPNAPVDSKTEVPGKPGVKILIQVKLLPHQWMM